MNIDGRFENRGAVAGDTLVTVLIVIVLVDGSLHALVGADAALPRVVGAESRDAAVARGEDLAARILPGAHQPTALLAKDFGHESFVHVAEMLRVVVCPLLAPSTPAPSDLFSARVPVVKAMHECSSWSLVPVSASTSTAAELPILVAATHATSLLQQQLPRPWDPPPQAAPAAGEQFWHLARRRHDAAQQQAKAALRGEPALQAFADSVGDPSKVSSLLEVPEEQRRSVPADKDARWKFQRFSEPVPRPATKPLPQPQPQPQPPQGFRPTRLADLLTDDAHGRLRRFLALNVLDMRELQKVGSKATRRYKPEPLILSQSDMVPEAGDHLGLWRVSEGIVNPSTRPSSPA